MQRNIHVIKDTNGNEIVIINDLIFKGKRNIDWDSVKQYLRNHIGEIYTIAATGEYIYIGKDFPDEYTGSLYTFKLKGTAAKAKANAAQGIPEIVEISLPKSWRENKKEKHLKDAANGWYRYDARFALPVYDDEGDVERYNVFHVSLIIRHASDDKKYLYDIIDIKKETGNPLQP